jgi:hypothetical protein
MNILKTIWQLAIGAAIATLVIILILWQYFKTSIPNFEQIRDEYRRRFSTEEACFTNLDGSKTNCTTPLNDTLLWLSIIGGSLFGGVSVISFFGGERFNRSIFLISLVSSIILGLLSFWYYSYEYNRFSDYLNANRDPTQIAYYSSMQLLPNMVYGLMTFIAFPFLFIFIGIFVVAFLSDQIFIATSDVVKDMIGGKRNSHYKVK